MDKKYIETVENDLKLYNHVFRGIVRFNEVDMVGKIHNVQYFYYFEWAKNEYFKNLGIPISSETYFKEFPIMTVHSEIDYFNSAGFGDEFEIFTRISAIRHSSMKFENIIRKTGGTILAKGSAIVVHYNPTTLKSERVPERLRKLIRNFEGEVVEIEE